MSKPAAAWLQQFQAEQAALPLSYPEVGATNVADAVMPTGYRVDRTRIMLGSGEAVYLAGRAALEQWQQFQLGWIENWPRDAPLQAGTVVVVMGRSLGLWWLNACRIVYTLNEAGPHCRFGFAYGTLPAHIERGEERFAIDWNQETDEVHFEILAFSRPSTWLARLGYPVVRRAQKRFGRSSAAAVFQFVHRAAPLPVVYQSSS